VQQGIVETLYQNGNSLELLLLLLLLFICLFFDPGTQFPGNEKNYAMQYQKVQKSSWNEPIIIIIIYVGVVHRVRTTTRTTTPSSSVRC